MEGEGGDEFATVLISMNGKNLGTSLITAIVSISLHAFLCP